MKRSELEDQLTARFKGAGLEQPALEARLLLSELLGSPTGELQTCEKFSDLESLLHLAQQWTEQRIEGMPLAYLSGKRGFYKNDFQVGQGVLVPRPETEHLIEVAFERSENVGHFADLGCGSGCLGLSLLQEMPESKLYALDASPVACEMTSRNVAMLGLIGRVQVLNTRVEDWVPLFLLDLIVANPPYIALADPNVESGVHKFEPAEALYSGAEGLDAIRSWSRWSWHNLTPGGLFVCEFGAGQSQQVREIIGALNFADIQIKRDFSGHERVISGYKAR